MTPIDPKKCNIQTVQNQSLPTDGPKAIPLILDWSTEDEYRLTFGNEQDRGFFSICQSVFIDNSQASSAFELAIEGTLQVLRVPQAAQAYLPVLAPNPLNLVFRRVDGSSNEFTKIMLLNFPVAPAVWSV